MDTRPILRWPPGSAWAHDRTVSDTGSLYIRAVHARAWTWALREARAVALPPDDMLPTYPRRRISLIGVAWALLVLAIVITFALITADKGGV